MLAQPENNNTIGINIVIFCNKKDFFLTRILVASIRHFYPNEKIYLVKDELNGNFRTDELEQIFKVEILNIGLKKFGWGSAKVHFLLSNVFKDQKCLILDSDIVFIGRVFDRFNISDKYYDFLVNADFTSEPYSEFVKSTYYDLNFFTEYNPSFKFPGYLFNTGQMIVTTGKLKEEYIRDFFDKDVYPYFKDIKHLPTVDQSLLNYAIPLQEQKDEIIIKTESFMLWSEGQQANELDLKKVKEGLSYKSLIHWAGAKRVPYLNLMSRSDILLFFEKVYFSHIPYGKMRYVSYRFSAWLDHIVGASLYSVKHILLKNFRNKKA